MAEERSRVYFSNTGGQKKTSFHSSVALVFFPPNFMWNSKSGEFYFFFSNKENCVCLYRCCNFDLIGYENPKVSFLDSLPGSIFCFCISFIAGQTMGLKRYFIDYYIHLLLNLWDSSESSQKKITYLNSILIKWKILYCNYLWGGVFCKSGCLCSVYVPEHLEARRPCQITWTGVTCGFREQNIVLGRSSNCF